MAGDWIKMRVDLADDPAVIEMAIALNIDEFGVVGRLHKLWSWADKHCTDGHVKSVTNVWIDRYIGHAGFAEAIANAGWLTMKESGVEFPKFARHNGESAKSRIEASERKRLQREKEKAEKERVEEEARQMSRRKSDKSVTREEKRREEILNTPIPPEGAKAARKESSISFTTYLAACKAADTPAIPADCAVFEYAEKAGIPQDLLRLHWLEFKDRYSEPGAKKYKAWPTVFCKSVRGNWFKLWYAKDGGYMLSTIGIQAQQTHKDKK